MDGADGSRRGTCGIGSCEAGLDIRSVEKKSVHLVGNGADCEAGEDSRATAAELVTCGLHEDSSEWEGGKDARSGVHNGGFVHTPCSSAGSSLESRGSAFEDVWHDVTRQSGSTNGNGGLVETARKSESRRALERCISASLKGFLIGTGLRGGFALFSVLVSLKRRAARRSSALTGISTNREAVKAALKESLRYGLFLSTYSGGFCAVDEAIAAVFGNHRTVKWRRLVAGALAGPSLLLTGRDTRHTSMGIYILLRAAVLAARVGIQSKDLGWLCRPLTWKHGDTFLMCLSSSQILWSWIMKPSSLPSSYVAFINKQGGVDPSIVKGIQEVALKLKPLPSLTDIQNHYRLRGINVEFDPYMDIPCKVIHGNQGCIPHAFSYFLRSYFRAVPVYIPVHLMGALLVQRMGLFRRDKRLQFLKKISLGIARSSLFLSVYATSAWLWTCSVFRATGTCTPALVATGTFPTGLALLLEQKSRRMEIALYCFSRAIESFAICVGESGILQRYNLSTPKRIDVVLFSLATAIIMQCYSMDDPDGKIIRPKYRNVLDWVFAGKTRDGWLGVKHSLSKDSTAFLSDLCSRMQLPKRPDDPPQEPLPSEDADEQREKHQPRVSVASA